MSEDREREKPEESSEAAAEGPGNVSVDEPTETSLNPSDTDEFDEVDEEGSKD